MSLMQRKLGRWRTN